MKQTTDTDGNEINNKVREIGNLLQLLPIKMKSFGNSNSARQITQFSDSIVVSFQLTDKNAFIQLLDDIMQIVVNFILKGYLVRGGITYGKLLHEENIVFGPAMISAYELESKIAIYPRIIFDKELVEELINNGDFALKSLFNDEIESTYFWKEDFDGKYYLNYMKGSEIYMDPSEYYGYFLPELRKFITKALRNRSNQSVRTKYGWLRTKFNEQLDLIDQYQGSSNSIKKIRTVI
ncbi:MAG: hypothetical protein WD053_06490 [Gracilimonas sp.]